MCLQCGWPEFDPWVQKIPWRREWLLTPVFLAGEFNGQRSHGVKESDMTERLTVSPSGTILVMTSSRCWYRTVSEWGWMGRTLQMTRLRNWRPWWRTGHPWGCGSLGMMAGLRARRTTVSQVLSHCDQEVYKWQQHGGRKLGITIWLKQVKLLSRVWLFATPWTVAHQAPPTMEFSRQEYWSGLPFPSPWGSSWPRDWTWVSHIVGRFRTLRATKKLPLILNQQANWHTQRHHDIAKALLKDQIVGSGPIPGNFPSPK